MVKMVDQNRCCEETRPHSHFAADQTGYLVTGMTATAVTRCGNCGEEILAMDVPYCDGCSEYFDSVVGEHGDR